MKLLLGQLRGVNVLVPVADAFDGTKYTQGINISGVGKVFFILQKGVGTSGTSTITVVAADGTSPLAETAVEFNYQRMPADDITPGAITKAATSGFVTTAGSNDSYIIEVDAQALCQTGYKYLCLKAVESVNSPVLGGVYAICTDLAHSNNTADIVS